LSLFLTGTLQISTREKRHIEKQSEDKTNKEQKGLAAIDQLDSLVSHMPNSPPANETAEV
jgi:hypothetical protein